MPIRTDRMALVPGSRRVLEADLNGRQSLAEVLDVEVHGSWPPPLYDADAILWILQHLDEDPEFKTWGFRYFIVGHDGGGITVGAGGFKGPPSEDGTVEIGYSVAPEYQRRGLASEAVRGLVARAFEEPQMMRVVAETLPDLVPSIGVLEKNGFRLTGPGSEPGDSVRALSLQAVSARTAREGEPRHHARRSDL